MKRIYRHTETIFEKLTAVVTTILGNSITFILALFLVVFWLVHDRHLPLDPTEYIRDVIHGVIFLTLFIIQKSFNRFTASLHLKVNELVVSHGTARNAVIEMDEKTEHEIAQMAKELSELAKEADIQKTGSTAFFPFKFKKFFTTSTKKNHL